MNEVYLGLEKDRQYIKTYLANIRHLDPIEIATLPNPIALTDPCIEEVIDIALFWRLTVQCLEAFSKRYAITLDELK